jgi:hypothetical protein
MELSVSENRVGEVLCTDELAISSDGGTGMSSTLGSEGSEGCEGVFAWMVSDDDAT